MKVKSNNKLSMIGVFSTTLFISAIVAYVFSPVFKSSADTINVGAEVGSIISLSLDKDSLALSGTPGSFVSGTVTTSVSTNSAFGYTLAMEDIDSDTNLVSQTSENTFTSTFSGSKTEAAMDANTWGFSIDGTNFYKVPTRNNPVALKRVQTHLDDGSDSATITIGAKIGMSTTSGLYQDQILFSAYANGADGSPDMSISSETGSGSGSGSGGSSSGSESESNSPVDPDLMQYRPIQNYSCDNLENAGDSETLRDVRDNKLYVVKKLADNRCWMVQNLRIANKKLTSNDTDLQAGQTFTLPQPSSITSSSFTVRDNNEVYLESTIGWYSWYSATAGTGTASTVTTPGQNAVSSICPKGWKLPTGGNNSEISALYDAYSWDANALASEDGPGLKANTGFFSNGNNGQRNKGFYWSSTLRTQTASQRNVYTVYLFPTAAMPISLDMGLNPEYGAPIHCINRVN